MGEMNFTIISLVLASLCVLYGIYALVVELRKSQTRQQRRQNVRLGLSLLLIVIGVVAIIQNTLHP
jgi:hypothetical protein